MEVSGRFVVLILVAVLHRQALAAKHTVGGSQGWDESTDFDSWASSQTFKVGDELGIYAVISTIVRFVVAKFFVFLKITRMK